MTKQTARIIIFLCYLGLLTILGTVIVTQNNFYSDVIESLIIKNETLVAKRDNLVERMNGLKTIIVSQKEIISVCSLNGTTIVLEWASITNREWLPDGFMHTVEFNIHGGPRTHRFDVKFKSYTDMNGVSYQDFTTAACINIFDYEYVPCIDIRGSK